MDPLTHALAGATVAWVAGGKGLGRRALVLGAVVGVLPDVDVLIRSAADPLLAIEHHRGFTHSLLFVPVGGVVAAVALRARAAVVAAMLAYGSHGLLGKKAGLPGMKAGAAGVKAGSAGMQAESGRDESRLGRDECRTGWSESRTRWSESQAGWDESRTAGIRAGMAGIHAGRPGFTSVECCVDCLWVALMVSGVGCLGLVARAYLPDA